MYAQIIDPLLLFFVGPRDYLSHSAMHHRHLPPPHRRRRRYRRCTRRAVKKIYIYRREVGTYIQLMIQFHPAAFDIVCHKGPILHYYKVRPGFLKERAERNIEIVMGRYLSSQTFALFYAP